MNRNSRLIAATADWVEPPHLWVALIGMPSTGKTPAQRPFIDACKLLEMDDRPAWQERMNEQPQSTDVCDSRMMKSDDKSKIAIIKLASDFSQPPAAAR